MERETLLKEVKRDFDDRFGEITKMVEYIGQQVEQCIDHVEDPRAFVNGIDFQDVKDLLTPSVAQLAIVHWRHRPMHPRLPEAVVAEIPRWRFADRTMVEIDDLGLMVGERYCDVPDVGVCLSPSIDGIVVFFNYRDSVRRELPRGARVFVRDLHSKLPFVTIEPIGQLHLRPDKPRFPEEYVLFISECDGDQHGTRLQLDLVYTDTGETKPYWQAPSVNYRRPSSARKFGATAGMFDAFTSALVSVASSE